jgi:uncharacterized protein (DUF433 family)
VGTTLIEGMIRAKVSMARDYVERRGSAFYIIGSRVPLDVIVHEYRNGAPAESIRQCFPTLTLEQIHGALAFYHGNLSEIDVALEEAGKQWKEFRALLPPPAINTLPSGSRVAVCDQRAASDQDLAVG